MNQPPAGPPPGTPPQQLAPPPPQKQAGMVAYKRELRKAIAKNATEPEINFLNITAMLDMMTIILVFLLKSLSASTASLPQSQDLQVPKSVLTNEPPEAEGLSVLISRSQIIAGDSIICPVPPDAAQYGVETKYKNGNRSSLTIVPLASALDAWRESDKQIRRAQGKDPNASEAVVVADQSTPYRLLQEVLNTLGQTGFARYHLLVLQSKSGT